MPDEWGVCGGRLTGILMAGSSVIVETGRRLLERAGWKKDAIAEEIYFTGQDRTTHRTTDWPSLAAAREAKIYKVSRAPSSIRSPWDFHEMNLGCSRAARFELAV